MYEALIKNLGSLPDETVKFHYFAFIYTFKKILNLSFSFSQKVYCGHEYTAANLMFGQHVEPDNEAIKEKIEKVSNLRKSQIPTVPSTISEEKLTNPFMRVQESSVMEHAKTNDPVAAMAAIRKEKDNFKC